MVLVNNKSGLNVCPLKVASCLSLGHEDFTPTKQTVKVYDNSKKEVIGIISMDVPIDLNQFVVKFLVLDVLLSFNMLLGRH